MRITIIADDGLVGIDGEFRKVDLSDLDPAIHAVQFDTVAGAGHVEFKRSAQVPLDVRDFDAELAAERAAGPDRGKQQELKPITRKILVPRDNERIADFTPYQVFAARWRAAGLGGV